jgi:anthranilate synthase/aminodeoxychorismate synthase-like glutamine amidotransferase
MAAARQHRGGRPGNPYRPPGHGVDETPDPRARRGRRRPLVLVIDNYDSFTWNLVQCLGVSGARVEVYRNDQITVDRVADLRPDRIVISPGPGSPAEAGVSRALIERLAGHVPILGVCLGHQVLAETYGGMVRRAPAVVHGKVSAVYHDGRTLYAGLPSPFEAMRYHSLLVERDDLPACLEVSAWTDDGLVMGLRHRHLPLEGVQFHPESILTTVGPRLVGAFVHLNAR